MRNDNAATAAAETLPEAPPVAPEAAPAPAPAGWMRRLLGLTGAPSDASSPADRLLGRQLVQPALDNATQAAQTAAAESVRSRIAAARDALAEAIERRDALESAIAGSGDMRGGVTWGFRRPAAAKAAALAAARDSVAAAAAEVAPSGGGDLAAALDNAAGAVLTDVSRALTAAADAADVERMTEAATARDAVAQFDAAYRARLEVQVFDLPVSKRRCEVLQAAINALGDDARRAGGLATDADDVIASVVAAPHPVALCARCAHGAAAAGGRPPLVYVGRGDGPACARCAPSEAGGNHSRRYVVRVADRGAVGAAWLPFVCVDDAAVEVEVDPAVLDKRGAPLPIPTEIVALPDGRLIERRRGGPPAEVRGMSTAEAESRAPRRVWPRAV